MLGPRLMVVSRPLWRIAHECVTASLQCLHLGEWERGVMEDDVIACAKLQLQVMEHAPDKALTPTTFTDINKGS